MTLKEKLPQWETDYLMPAWLILAILAAAVAETVVVGYGVQKLYGLWLGWPVGFVVASTQALGSQMYSYNATHNSRRYIKWRTRQGQRYFNEWEAEPALNVWLPLAVSIGAGVVAGSVGVALYRSISDTLSVALVALSVASPAGSIAAALLNGLFASGELALKGWREAMEADVKSDKVDDRPTPKVIEAPITMSDLPDWLPVVPANLDEFRQLVAVGTIKLTAEVTGAALAEHVPAVGSNSTGRYWLRQVRNGKVDQIKDL
jgi:hypothetical protein